MKRSAKILVIVAAVAFAFVFFVRGRQSRLAVHVGTMPQVHKDTAAEKRAEGMSIEAGAGVPFTKRFSEQEYDLLWRRYRPNMPQAAGPMSVDRLDMLARNTRTNTLDERMWPVFKDVIYGNFAALENRLDTGLSANATIYLGYPYNNNVSLLDMAIKAGQRGMIRLLLSHGASIDQLSVVGPDGTPLTVEAPLPLAAGDGEDDVVRLLLQDGENIEQRRGLQENDQTALDAAVYSQNVSTAYLLLTSGADINTVLGPGGTVPPVLTPPYLSPRMIALRNLLMEYGAKLPSG